ncbi:glycosyltransferase, partial [Desulfothermus okinawensis]
YMAHADVFVLSSLWEGLPVSLIEALALGTPAISTDCPSGSREILQNGKYGPLVPLRDYKKMAEAIIQVIKNPLPANFLKKAARPYTIKNATDAYLKAFGLIDN